MHGQPRKRFEPEALEELASSIRTSGVIQPLVVRELDDGMFGLVAGERRWRASQLAGLEDVPVVVRELSDRDAFAVALIENVQREDLNPIEEAEAYQHLIEEFGITQREAAERVGRSRVAVTNTLRLLSLAPAVRHRLADGTISAGHARAILTAPAEFHEELADRVENESLTVRATEKLARAVGAEEPGSPAESDAEISSSRDTAKGTTDDLRTAQVRDVERQLREKLSARVQIKRKSDLSGTIEISFADTSGLNAIIDGILGE